jgi:hypothetical protein
MGEKIRRLIQQQWAGLLALFLVLSGGTAVASHETIFSSDIVDGEVKSADVRNDSLSGGGLAAADLRAGSVQSSEVLNDSLTGADIANNSLTGTDVQESSLALAAEGWHEVLDEGLFYNRPFCAWSNFDATHNSAAFLRDRHGFVHLKGLVDADDLESNGCDFSSADQIIFVLRAGYLPAKREVHVTLTNGALGRITVDPDPPAAALGIPPELGTVLVESPTTEANAKEWVSLDGITFRCAPSGSDGCP